MPVEEAKKVTQTEVHRQTRYIGTGQYYWEGGWSLTEKFNASPPFNILYICIQYLNKVYNMKN